jgi:ABC-type lipopolysaccharide export system ATPase subunit
LTNAQPPVTVLRAQARRVALTLKTAERTGAGVKPGAREKPEVKFAVAMDDKTIFIEMPWASVAELTVEELTTYIAIQMRKEGELPQ